MQNNSSVFKIPHEDNAAEVILRALEPEVEMTIPVMAKLAPEIVVDDFSATAKLAPEIVVDDFSVKPTIYKDAVEELTAISEELEACRLRNS